MDDRTAYRPMSCSHTEKYNDERCKRTRIYMESESVRSNETFPQIISPFNTECEIIYHDHLPSIDLRELPLFILPSLRFSLLHTSSVARKRYPGFRRVEGKCKISQNVTGVSKQLDLSERLESMKIDEGYESMPQNRPKTSPHWDLYEILTAKNEDGDTLLNLCIILGQTECTFWIINLSPSSVCVNIPNRLFQTPLHLAVIMEQAEVVRRLMVAGANLEARDARGNTALHIACEKGLIHIIEILLETISEEETSDNTYDATYINIPQNLELRNCDGFTCFHIAVLRYDLIMMELLASKGSNINTKELKSGKTPLHMAVESGDVFIVNFLLNLDQIDVNGRMYNGTSAVELAYYLEYHAVVLFLHENGATDVAPVVNESENESHCSDSGSDFDETSDSDVTDSDESADSKQDVCTYEENMNIEQKDCGFSEELERSIHNNLSANQSDMETESVQDAAYLTGEVKPRTLLHQSNKLY